MRITRICRRRYLRRGREAVGPSARNRIFSEYLLRSCNSLFGRFLRLHIMQDDVGPPRREHVLVAALCPSGVEDEELRNRIAEQSQLAIGLAVRVFGPPRIILYDRYHGGCALQARRARLPEMAAAAKPSEQPRTESCVASGDGR